MEDGNRRAEFRVTERFKGAPPYFSELVTTGVLNGMPTSAATNVNVGSRYLIFIDNDARLDFCPRSFWLDSPYREATETLKALRDFDQGKIPDLSEPWHFGRAPGSCSLQHSFASGLGSDLYERTWLDSQVFLTDSPILPVREEEHSRARVHAEIVLRRNVLPEDESISILIDGKAFAAPRGQALRSSRLGVTYRLSAEAAETFAEHLPAQCAFSIGAADSSESDWSTTVRITRGREDVQRFADCIAGNSTAEQ